tara:strand:+ start:159 stop:1346 length:1188 start_codon:yes stop_codon:yes gene_type:complete
MSTLKVNAIRGRTATSDAVTLAADGTCTVKATNKSNRNIWINGACNVAQRSTSASGSNGYHTLDRLYFETANNDEGATFQQVDVASGTTPYTLGFRKCAKILNGNQTGGAGAADTVEFSYSFEAQDLATSGWNYKSASSYITLSFWVKSSVAQNFYGYFRARDGSAQMYSFDTGSLSADTWTKVTKTIPGNSNLTFDNNNGNGLTITFDGYRGTSAGGNGATLHTWFAENNATRTPAQTTTWYTTNDSTLEFTGFQMEVGDVATDFEHRLYPDELLRCQRYCMKWEGQNTGGNHYRFPMGIITGNTTGGFPITHSVPMRAVESRGISHNISPTSSQSGGGGNQSSPTLSLDIGGCGTMSSFIQLTNLDSGRSNGDFWSTRVGSDNDWYLIVENEL